MQALYLLTLDPVVETQADFASYGFRVGRGCADAIERCFNAFVRPNPAWILEGDIKGCFEHISHEWLLDHVPMDRSVLRKWLKSGYLERQVYYDTVSGTPQGGIISPALANCALDGLENVLRTHFPLRGPGSWHGKAARVHLIRYADDFIVTGVSKELLETRVKPLVEAFLRERGLALSAEKTRITNIQEGFNFLGQNVRRYPNGKLLIKPSRASIANLLIKAKSIVRRHHGSAAHLLIMRLNPLIRGWAYYHRHVISKRIFSRVDDAIFRMTWNWARARHPRKGRRWIKRRYFERVKTRDWWFFGDNPNVYPQLGHVRLFHATSVRIVRHVAVRCGLNPYDPVWAPYLAKRALRRRTLPTVSSPWASVQA
jgi:RNA-directed DNA polymerase